MEYGYIGLVGSATRIGKGFKLCGLSVGFIGILKSGAPVVRNTLGRS